MAGPQMTRNALEDDTMISQHPQLRVCDGSFRLITVENYLRTGEFPTFTNSQEKQNFMRYSTKFQLFDDILYYVGPKKQEKRQVVLTQEKRDEVLKECHWDQSTGSHQGFSRTQKKVALSFYWKEITKDVKEWVLSCPQCQKAQKNKLPCDIQSPVANEPWELVGVDLIGPFTRTLTGNTHVCLMSDIFTKWVVAAPVPDKAPSFVARVLLRAVYVHGSPKKFLIDQNKKFIKELSNGVSEMFCLEYANAGTFHANGRGQEATVDIVIPVLTKYAEMGYQDNWDDYLSAITYGINTTVHPSTNCTPFFMMYGRHPRPPLNLNLDCSPGDELKGTRGTPKEIYSSYIENITRVHDKTIKNIRKSQIMQRKQTRNCRSREGKGSRRSDKDTLIQNGNAEPSDIPNTADEAMYLTDTHNPVPKESRPSPLEVLPTERPIQVQSNPSSSSDSRNSTQNVCRMEHPYWHQNQQWHYNKLETTQNNQNYHDPSIQTELRNSNQLTYS